MVGFARVNARKNCRKIHADTSKHILYLPMLNSCVQIHCFFGFATAIDSVTEPEINLVHHQFGEM